MAAEYTILSRDLWTLALLGEIHEYLAARWVRRVAEKGEFEITVQRGTVADDLLAVDRVIEIRRSVEGDPDPGTELEFAGIIQHATYDAITELWTVSGPCLLWLIEGREVKPASGQEYDSVEDTAAETALKGYVGRHLTAPTDTERNINGELDGITFDIEPDEGRGSNVSFAERWVNLLTGCLQQLVVDGNLLHAVEFQPEYAGYRYLVREPVDATWATGETPVIFATLWGNVSHLRHEQDQRALVTDVYVLGDGEGASRVVRAVGGTSSGQLRREASLGGQRNATDAALDQEGQSLIDESRAASRRLDVQPLPVGPTQYRVEWDLGYDVTVAIPEIGLEQDHRIVEVAVSLDQQQGEVIEIAIGAAPRNYARILAQELRRARRPQVA